MSDKKPWEYEEIVVEPGVGDYVDDLWLYAGPDMEIGMISSEAPGGAEAWAALFKASPKLAQALLRYRLQHGENCICEACTMGRSALGLAGVPLP